MRVAAVILLFGVCGCYSPHPQAGSPCDVGPCPSGLVCSPATLTCELTAIDAATIAPIDTRTVLDASPIDASPIDAASVVDVRVVVDTIAVDACTPAPELCGDGIDQSCDGVDPPCPPNDAPAGAIDVTAGGMFTADLSAAHDDAGETGCGSDGGRDVFYKVVLAAPQVYYVDTFGSSFGTIVRAFPGVDCASIGAATPACSANACGGTQSQLATSLPAGTSCIVVDQHAGDTTGALTMTIKPGTRDGAPLLAGMRTNTGSSCSGSNASQPSTACSFGGSKTAEDVAYYFTACPAQTLMLDASTCVDSTVTDYDTVIYLRAAGAAGTLGCNDDNNSCMPRPDRPDHADGSVITGVAATGPNLFWLTVDGYNGACGPYQLDTNLR